jgi:hypothetical protein
MGSLIVLWPALGRAKLRPAVAAKQATTAMGAMRRRLMVCFSFRYDRVAHFVPQRVMGPNTGLSTATASANHDLDCPSTAHAESLASQLDPRAHPHPRANARNRDGAGSEAGVPLSGRIAGRRDAHRVRAFERLPDYVRLCAQPEPEAERPERPAPFDQGVAADRRELHILRARVLSPEPARHAEGERPVVPVVRVAETRHFAETRQTRSSHGQLRAELVRPEDDRAPFGRQLLPGHHAKLFSAERARFASRKRELQTRRAPAGASLNEIAASRERKDHFVLRASPKLAEDRSRPEGINEKVRVRGLREADNRAGTTRLRKNDRGGFAQVEDRRRVLQHAAAARRAKQRLAVSEVVALGERDSPVAVRVPRSASATLNCADPPRHTTATRTESKLETSSKFELSSRPWIVASAGAELAFESSEPHAGSTTPSPVVQRQTKRFMGGILALQ